MKTDFWKTLACALAGVVVSGLVTWMAFAQGAVTREEMASYVTERTEGTRETLRELKVAVERVAVLQNQSVIEQRVTAEQVRQLLKTKE